MLTRPSLSTSPSLVQGLRLPADVPGSSLSVTAQPVNGSGQAVVQISLDLLLLTLVFKSLMGETFLTCQNYSTLRDAEEYLAN